MNTLRLPTERKQGKKGKEGGRRKEERGGGGLTNCEHALSFFIVSSRSRVIRHAIVAN